MVTPTPEVYERELDFLQKEAIRFSTFTEFRESFNDPSEELITTLRSLHSSRPGFILDPDQLRELKVNQPSLHKEIVPAYMSFLQDKVGVSRPEVL